MRKSKHNYKFLMTAFLKQEISGQQWIMNLNIEATIRYLAEVVDDSICCCDTGFCVRDFLSQCHLALAECEVEVTIKLSHCKTCPSVCCLIYDVGSTQNVRITDASFQIDGEPSNTVIK